jgi:hypothetical protein
MVNIYDVDNKGEDVSSAETRALCEKFPTPTSLIYQLHIMQ